MMWLFSNAFERTRELLTWGLQGGRLVKLSKKIDSKFFWCD